MDLARPELGGERHERRGCVHPAERPRPDGSTYVTWFENATGAYVLKMQRLDVDGQALWATGGIVVSDEPQNSALSRFDFKSDHAGNAIVVFQDERSGALDVVAYKISPAGDALWAGGLPLLTPGATGIGPVIQAAGPARYRAPALAPARAWAQGSPTASRLRSIAAKAPPEQAVADGLRCSGSGCLSLLPPLPQVSPAAGVALLVAFSVRPAAVEDR